MNAVLACCLLYLLVSSSTSSFNAWAQSSGSDLQPEECLTSAAQVRSLSPAIASRKAPVKLRAVVTAVSGKILFIQDTTGGTFVRVYKKEMSGRLAPGDIIEVEGTTWVGRFLPGIDASGLRLEGHGELPQPTPATFEDLLSARWHYQRVEISGIVRSVTPASTSERLSLSVAVGQRKLDVQVLEAGTTALPPLVDARVRLTGLAAGHINKWRQLVAPQLVVNRLDDIQVETPPPADPFSAPLTSQNELLNFNAAGVSVHRVRVRGVVTWQQPGKAVFLRDDNSALFIQTTQADALQPGDLIEAIGFPAMDRFSAYLEDAEFRVTGHGEAPQPLPIAVADLLEKRWDNLLGTNRAHDANLVSVDAQLVEVLDTPAETVLAVNADNSTFRARLPHTSLSLRNGARLRLTGICRVTEAGFSEVSFGAWPRAIELWLRSPADITVLSMPSRWTGQQLAAAGGLLLVLAVAALIWIARLRHRVTQQAEIIRQKLQREAALEERHRMAREIHDTLAQSFSGLGFQLEALNARLPAGAEEARSQLELARHMVRHGQEGFRRSLMNLRAQELERGSLEQALPETARQITADAGIELTCEVHCPRHNLPEAVEANLLRIAQECLTNAVRHAHPKRIELTLQQAPNALTLRIADDGAGFNPEQLDSAPEGHFGWRGIRERAEQIRAQVELHSQPGAGTIVTVTVPL